MVTLHMDARTLRAVAHTAPKVMGKRQTVHIRTKADPLHHPVDGDFQMCLLHAKSACILSSRCAKSASMPASLLALTQNAGALGFTP